MERIQPMTNPQILEKVEDLAGKSARILDCEQNTINQTEEVLLVNGVAISLKGEEGARIKEALMHGEVPPCDIVNSMLTRVGIESSAVEVETLSSVKSSTKTVEHSTLVDSHGVLIDEKMREKEDEDEFKTHNVEIWMAEPADKSQNKQTQRYHQQQQSNNSNLTDKNHPNNKQTSNEKPSNKTKNKKSSKGSSSKEENPEKKSIKKSIFSPSSIIRGSGSNNKDKVEKSMKPAKIDKNDKKAEKVSDKKIKVSEQEQQQQHRKEQQKQSSQQSVITSTSTQTVNTNTKMDNRSISVASSSPQVKSLPQTQSPPNTNVPKNKFLALFSKGKSKDKVQNDEKQNKKQSYKNEQEQLKNSHNNQYKSATGATDKNQFQTKKQNVNVNYLDPSLSLVHVEIDGIPVKVVYETFV